jgi:1-deoxy-D-xylulose-5-phosphate synthase
MPEYKQGELLKNIIYPEDLKKLSKNHLPQLCKELREYILEILSENPGHLASSLGTIELSVAIHYLFDVPKDTLIWDVGHQAYAHKVLTGRKDNFNTIRSLGGISGFPRRDESEYDCFGTGHSSTSISAALGMALADKMNGENHCHIAVIGDGALTGGIVFEALNNASETDANLLIILNDNGISIDGKVGAMSRYLTNITISAKYNRLKNKIWNILGGNTLSYSRHKSFIKKVLLATKYVFSGKSTFFEALGIRYFGPVNGNDINDLIKTLQRLKHIKGVKILHIITKKGKGLPQAEKNPTTYHAPGLFNPQTGEIKASGSVNDVKTPRFQDVFGETLVELATMDKRVVGISPAMLSGCSMDRMMNVFPDRTFDVGIAEQHAVTFSAGLATQGFVPFCNIYSSFMQRAYDQIIHDVALQKLHVVLCLDRAGLVGADGATHHGAFDLAYLRCVPNLIVAAPLNEMELRDMLFTALNTASAFAIRYPRGNGYNLQWRNDMKMMPVGKGITKAIQESKIAVLALGTIGNNALSAIDELHKEGIDVAFYNMRFLKPLDTALLEQALSKHHSIITIEDGVIAGGFGSAVMEYATEKGFQNNIVRLGLPDAFVEHGSTSELQHLCGIDVESIVRLLRKFK